MAGPQCARCGYSIEGLAEVGRQVRCPECGYEQLLRLSPDEVQATGAWFSSFFLAAAIPVVGVGSFVLVSPLLPIGDGTYRAVLTILILGSLALFPLVGVIRFTRRLTKARRLAGWPPESLTVRITIAATTYVLFGALFFVAIVIAAIVISTVIDVMKH